MNLELGKSYSIPWFDPTGSVVTDADLVCRLLDRDGTELVALPMTQSSDIPNSFWAEQWVATLPTVWTARITQNTDILDQFRAVVDQRAVPDKLPDVAEPLSILSSRIAVPTIDLAARVSYVVEGATVTTASMPAASVPATLSYDTDPYTFPAAGLYLVVWYDGAYPVVADTVLVGKRQGKEAFQLNLRDEAGEPYQETIVVLSRPTGEPVDQNVTDASGFCVLLAYPGEYVVTYVRAGRQFSVNNQTITIVNTDLVGGANRLLAHIASFVPSLRPPATVVPVCLMYCDLYTMEGKPLANADIQVSVLNGPGIVTGAGVMDVRRLYGTDQYGHAEMTLLRGADIEIVIAPTGVRRQIKVPNEAGPINLLTLLEQANDPFTILRPSIPGAPRREL